MIWSFTCGQPTAFATVIAAIVVEFDFDFGFFQPDVMGQTET